MMTQAQRDDLFFAPGFRKSDGFARGRMVPSSVWRSQR